MNDRGMKKYRPFNSVVPNKELLREERIVIPELCEDTIKTFEEILKKSLYNSSNIKVKYLYNNKICELIDTVIKLDSITKNIYFKHGKIINFRQLITLTNI